MNHRHVGAKWEGKGQAPRLSVSELQGLYKGQDIWVIGSASSMNYVSSEFFQNKVTIGVNYAYRNYPCDWVVTKDFCQTEYNELGSFLITSKHLWGSYAEGEFGFWGREPFYVFDHVHNEQETVDLSVIGTERIVVGKTSLISAMHIAVYMGAANIILCGVDGGTLDRNLQYNEYANCVHEPAAVEEYSDFVSKIMSQIRDVRDRLIHVYGCQVHSLNPFIGFDFEGHVYERANPS